MDLNDLFVSLFQNFNMIILLLQDIDAFSHDVNEAIRTLLRLPSLC
jgi:hypothetical protein